MGNGFISAHSAPNLFGTMAFTVTGYCDVAERAKALHVNEPTGLALLPRNFLDAKDAGDLLHESSALTIRSLFRQNKIDETRIEKDGQRIPTIQENDSSLILPTLFVSGLILSGNPALLSIALNVISNYATDFFKGISGRKKVKLDVIVQHEKGKDSKRIQYEGEPDGLREISKIVSKVFHDGK